MTEQYPDGNPKTIAGSKKPDLSLVPPSSLLHLSTAMMNGATKYGAYNWREKNISTMVYIAAAMRHLLSYLDGEDYALDSGCHHLAHAMACCAIVLDAEACGTLNDNRPQLGPASYLIEMFNRTPTMVGPVT